MSKKIVPLANYVLFRRHDAVGDLPVRCIVVASGPGLMLPSTGQRCGPMVLPGDTILIRSAGVVSVVEVGGEKMYLVGDQDLIGVIVDDELPALTSVP